MDETQPQLGPDETLDAIGEGLVRLVQRRAGYRFNLDAVLLAGFALEGPEPARALRVVDLGTGSGVVGLLLAARRPAWRVSGVEVQPALAALARRNAALNGLPFEVVESDWRTLPRAAPAGGYDLVVCNPPYFAPAEGRTSVDAERAAARFELHGGLEDLAAAAGRVLSPRGSARFILAAPRLFDLATALDRARLRPVRLRFVHAHAGEEAYAVLVEAQAGSRTPLRVEAPLVVHGATERFTPEVARLLTREG